MVQVHLLGSGSDGNATLVVSGDTAILIDAGLGPRQLGKRLAPLGLSLSDIEACFITHEHVDHVSGLSARTFPGIPIFANALTIRYAQWQFPMTRGRDWQEMPVGAACQIGELTLESFATSHDAACSVGYIVHSVNRVLLFATDLGCLNDTVAETIPLADFVILESNHDPFMLQNGPYPLYLKERVAGDKGHLSNFTTAEGLALNLGLRTSWIALAHLSRTNNTPDLALATTSAALNNRSSLNSKLTLAAAPALASGKILSWEG